MTDPETPTTLAAVVAFCKGKGANWDAYGRNTYERGYRAACNSLAETLAPIAVQLDTRLAEHHEVIVTLKECADAANTRAQAAEADCERLREENAANVCPHTAEGKGCACERHSRHDWFKAYAELKDSLARLRVEQEQKDKSIEQLVGDVQALNGSDVQLTALQDAVKEDIDARYAQAALACSGSTNKYEWLKASQRVDAASKALRTLVDPPQQKETP